MTKAQPRHRVLVCIPTIDGDLSVATTLSLVRSVSLASQVHKVSVQRLAGCSIIALARNLLVAEFMAGDFDTLFFIDADMGWNADAFMRMINREEEFLAAACCGRTDESQDILNVRWLDEDVKSGNLPIQPSGVIEAKSVGTGFMRVRRSVIEKMQEAHSDKLFYHTNAPNGAYGLFENDIQNCKYLGEDFVFCQRWRALGGRIFIDPDVTIEHVGKKSWKTNLSVSITKFEEEYRANNPAAELPNLFDLACTTQPALNAVDQMLKVA